MAEPTVVLTEMEAKAGKDEKAITDIDEILKHTGEIGKYQFIITILLGLTVVSIGYPILIMTFAGLNPPWQCAANNTFCTMNGTFSSADTDNYKKRCSMPRSAWEFTKPKEFSIVTQFDIYCDREYFIYLSSTLLFVGWGVGSIFLGWLTDSYGRRKVLYGAAASVILFNFLSAFSPNIEVFCTFRFVIGLFYPATMVNPSVLLGEMVGPKHRPMFGSTTALAFGLSLLFTGCKAYFVREWKTLIMICSAPYTVVLLCYFYVPESIRWLRLHGEHSKIIEILKKGARINGRSIPENIELSPLSDADIIKTRSNLMDLFRPTRMFFLTCAQGYIWMAVAAVYYGISLGVGQLTGELYRDFVLATAIEIPSVIAAIMLMVRPGRKPTMVMGMILSGVFCGITGGLINDKDLKTWRLLFGLLGKICITIAFNTIYTWSFELYPTSVRGAGMSFVQITARVGSAMAPWLAKGLGVFHIAIPFSLMGALSLLAGFICMVLPETRGVHTLETTKEVIGVKKPKLPLIAVNEHAKA